MMHSAAGEITKDEFTWNHSRFSEHRKEPSVRVHKSEKVRAARTETNSSRACSHHRHPAQRLSEVSVRLLVQLTPLCLSHSLADRPFSFPMSNGTISVFHTLGSKFSLPLAV